jgi:hypothetical protein
MSFKRAEPRGPSGPNPLSERSYVIAQEPFDGRLGDRREEIYANPDG